MLWLPAITHSLNLHSVLTDNERYKITVISCNIICSVFWQHVSFWKLFQYFSWLQTLVRKSKWGQNKLQISTGRVGFPKFHWASTKSECPVTSETTRFRSQSTNYNVVCICIQKKSLPTSMTQVACRMRHNKKVWGKLHIADKTWVSWDVLQEASFLSTKRTSKVLN